MSRLSFKVFCIEKYADRVKMPSNEVFRLFEKNGILQMLDQDYELIHGHGFEYIANDIDKILEGRPCEGAAIMAHGTIRAATLKTILPMIMEKENCDENEAIKRFYESHIGACYADDETGLYGQSALYVFSLYEADREESANRIT